MKTNMITGSLQIKNNHYYCVINVITNNKHVVKRISTGLTADGNKKKAEELLKNSIAKHKAMESTSETRLENW